MHEQVDDVTEFMGALRATARDLSRIIPTSAEPAADRLE
jgi:hypothetical protein